MDKSSIFATILVFLLAIAWNARFISKMETRTLGIGIGVLTIYLAIKLVFIPFFKQDD